MRQGLVDLVVTGADRIARNRDTANKIGTYGAAVLARHHDVPFYVAAPISTVDLDTPTGGDIPIEEREAEEVTSPMGFDLAEPGTPVANPAFDVTPAELVSAIVTDRGVIRQPYGAGLRELVGRKGAA
jgi:methylthioribose-1-phosphate isomerase